MSIRKSIKKISFEEPKGVHIKAFVGYLFILSFISYIGIYFINDNNLIVLFSFLLTLPLYLNLIRLCLDAGRDKLIDFWDLFKIKKYSFKFTLYYSLFILIFYLLNIVIGLIPIFGFIINTVIFVYLFPIFIIMPFVFLDDVNISIKELINKSLGLMNKKRVLFYGLLFSFTLWFILGFVTLGILYLWLIPYIFISMAYLYLSLKEEKSFKEEKSLSNNIIILLFLLFIVITDVISFKIYPENFSSFKEYINIK